MRLVTWLSASFRSILMPIDLSLGSPPSVPTVGQRHGTSGRDRRLPEGVVGERQCRGELAEQPRQRPVATDGDGRGENRRTHRASRHLDLLSREKCGLR